MKWIRTVSETDFIAYVDKNGTDKVYKDDASLLHLAVYSKREELIDVLLLKGANPNKVDQYFGDSPLKRAVNLSDEVFRNLLETGANPDLRRDKRPTALMRAALLGEKEKVELLLEFGAEIDSKDSDGKSAIFYAVIGKEKDIILYLSDNGANLNFIDNEGFSVYGKAWVLYGAEMLQAVCNSGNEYMSGKGFQNFRSQLSRDGLDENEIEALGMCGVASPLGA